MAGVLSFSVWGQSRKSDFKMTLKTEFLPTPVYVLSNYDNEVPSLSSQWLAIKVTYTPPSVKDGSDYLWVDDIRMDVELMFSAKYQNKSIMGYATGKIEFWAIQFDGRRHQAMMMLPPQVLQRYGDQTASNYRKLKIYTRVKFTNTRNNSVIGMLIAGSNANDKETEINRVFDQLSSPVAAVLRLPNLILPVEKTPWRFIDMDSYDMIKPSNDGN
jgi:hypothetical protein